VKKESKGRKHTLVAVSLVLIQTMPTAKIMRSACVDLEISELYRVDHPIFESWIREKVGEGRKTWRNPQLLLEERRREEPHAQLFVYFGNSGIPSSLPSNFQIVAESQEGGRGKKDIATSTVDFEKSREKKHMRIQRRILETPGLHILEHRCFSNHGV
jgi:hypothetical protein